MDDGREPKPDHRDQRDAAVERAKELSFSDMTAEKMAAMAPMEIVEHNTRLLNHSNIVVFRK